MLFINLSLRAHLNLKKKRSVKNSYVYLASRINVLLTVPLKVTRTKKKNVRSEP